MLGETESKTLPETTTNTHVHGENFVGFSVSRKQSCEFFQTVQTCFNCGKRRTPVKANTKKSEKKKLLSIFQFVLRQKIEIIGFQQRISL